MIKNPYELTKRAADTMNLVAEGRLYRKYSTNNWEFYGGSPGSWESVALEYADAFLAAGLIKVPFHGAPAELTPAGDFLFHTFWRKWRAPHVAYAADMVLFRDLGLDNAEVLLIRRGNEPFQGAWALPGGYVEAGDDETAFQAAIRETEEETGIAVDPTGSGVELVGVYDAADRDPRGRVVSAAYAVELDHPVTVRAGDDASDARWVRLASLDHWTLAFDHASIIHDALVAVDRIRV